MGEFKNLLAQLYMSSQPRYMSFDKFVEHIQVAIHHSTKLSRRCAKDLEMPLDVTGGFIFHKEPS